MKKIKFSHNYIKLHNQKNAVLLEVLEVKLQELSKPFLEADTYIGDSKYFQIPKSGNYLLLIFGGDREYMFTTLRPAFPQIKVEYYKNSIGETFEIVLAPQK